MTVAEVHAGNARRLCFLLLAASGLVFYFLYGAGRLVHSPEFGATMVQGSGARLALQLGILALSVSAGAIWYSARTPGSVSPASPALRLRFSLTAALLIGGLAASRSVLVSAAEDPAPLHVYAYSWWWPPLLLWIAFCAGESVLAMAGYRPVGWRRVWAAAVLLAGVSLLAYSQPGVDVTATWAVCLLLFVPGCMALGGRAVLEAVREPVGVSRKRRIVENLVAACVWVLTLGGLLLVDRAKSSGTLTGSAVAWAGVPLLLLPWAFLIARDRRPVIERLAMLWMAARGWGGLASRSLLEIENRAETALLRGWAIAWPRSITVARRIRAGLAALFSASSIYSALAKTVVGLVVLVALSDLPDAGKLVIEPFSTHGPADSSDIGQLVSDRLSHDLRSLSIQLQPSMIPEAAAGGKGGAPRKSTTVSTGAGNADEALRTSPGLAIGSVTIPLEIFHFIHAPMRWILRVRSVSGTVYADRDSYTVLARSTAGLTWAIRCAARSKQDTIQQDTIQQDTIQQHTIRQDTIRQDTIRQDTPPAHPIAQDEQPRAASDVAAELADDLAYQILSTDPELAVEGLTTSWEAFDAFRRGFRTWQVYDSRKDYDYSTYDSLTLAIRQFRQAVAADPSFAIAHYRLGIALQEDGQQAAAVEAFRASLTANPRFIPAYNALAFNLHFLMRGGAEGEVLSDSSNALLNTARVDEAHRRWQQILRAEPALVSPQDRAAAYSGLCNEAALDLAQYQAAYFYCTRAARLYLDLPAPVLSSARVRQAAATPLNLLGIVLEQSSTRKDVAPPEWSCGGRTVDAQGKDTIAGLGRSPYERAAQRYYEEALELLPSDQVIRCNAAVSAYANGDTSRMKELEEDPAAHAALGSAYGEKALLAGSAPAAARLFRLALDEHESAVKREPANVTWLNNYAYAVWQWRREWPGSEGPDLTIARQAERYARAAVAIAMRQESPLQLYARSTLGEVLLGQGRAHEAVEVLQALFADSLVPNHSYYDEIRWDLAQAALCAAAADGHGNAQRREHARSLWKMADTIISGARRNRQPTNFSARLRQLDPSRAAEVCQVPGTDPLANPRYALRRSVGQRDTPCDWGRVAAYVRRARERPVDEFQLHVWGEEVDDRILLRSTGSAGRAAWLAGTALLTTQPRATHGIYFAQLEQKGRQVSPVYPIETFANDGMQCSNNLIELTFTPR